MGIDHAGVFHVRFRNKSQKSWNLWFLSKTCVFHAPFLLGKLVSYKLWIHFILILCPPNVLGPLMLPLNLHWRKEETAADVHDKKGGWKCSSDVFDSGYIWKPTEIACGHVFWQWELSFDSKTVGCQWQTYRLAQYLHEECKEGTTAANSRFVKSAKHSATHISTYICLELIL